MSDQTMTVNTKETKKKESNRPKAFSDTAIDMDYIFLHLKITTKMQQH